MSGGRIALRLGHAVAWIAPLIVVICAGVALARYGFDFGRVWLQELYVWLNAAFVLLGASYAFARDAHVHVDILARRFSPRTRDVIEIVGTLLFLLPFCAVILWFGTGQALASFKSGEASQQSGGLPALWVVKALLPVFAAGLLGHGAARAWSALARLRGPR